MSSSHLNISYPINNPQLTVTLDSSHLCPHAFFYPPRVTSTIHISSIQLSEAFLVPSSHRLTQWLRDIELNNTETQGALSHPRSGALLLTRIQLFHHFPKHLKPPVLGLFPHCHPALNLMRFSTSAELASHPTDSLSYTSPQQAGDHTASHAQAQCLFST